MTRGVILIAHNNRNDYYRMALWVAKRVTRFLNLPTTLITDQNTLDTTHHLDNSVFDQVLTIEPDRNNYLNKINWINKGRYQVYDLSPYDETIVLDTDYVINSTRLLDLFNYPSDFVCYKSARYMYDPYSTNEILHANSSGTYWATVMRFRKTQRVQNIFEMIKTIQQNYDHYADLHNFLPFTYRNDYALTLSLRAINGHMESPEDFISGRLQHIDSTFSVKRIDDITYSVHGKVIHNNRERPVYIKISGHDFHMMNKIDYLGMIADEQ
jgi:hypothetical protein